mmetsp:Transcript_150/g.240  ORF Transcript_150/g.240 Transcript_150/m.240 type:complete len:228 (-) Transcript_150:264-947(-)
MKPRYGGLSISISINTLCNISCCRNRITSGTNIFQQFIHISRGSDIFHRIKDKLKRSSTMIRIRLYNISKNGSCCIFQFRLGIQQITLGRSSLDNHYQSSFFSNCALIITLFLAQEPLHCRSEFIKQSFSPGKILYRSNKDNVTPTSLNRSSNLIDSCTRQRIRNSNSNTRNGKIMIILIVRIMFFSHLLSKSGGDSIYNFFIVVSFSRDAKEGSEECRAFCFGDAS